jgi:hypothetical protein
MRIRPLLCLTLILLPCYSLSDAIGASVGGNRAPDGSPIHCDLPASEHLKNKGGSDGAGLCVFTSIDHSARWHNVSQLVGFRDWMTKYPGGGTPEKVTAKIKQICAEKGVSEPRYFQYVGKDLELLKLACQSGRMPGVTYRYSPTGRYGGAKIWHMVSLVHADDKHFAVLDNNYPGVALYEWMTPAEFGPVWIQGGGWFFVLLDPGPPPPPKN